MFRILVASFMLLSAPALAQQSAPEIPYNSVPDALKLPPDLNMGEAAGVAVNSKGHIFVFHRGGSSRGPAFANTAAQLWEFDADGNFIREIGKNLYAWSFAHAVRVDKDDNIWAIDKGSDMIIRFNPQGRVTMVIGRKQEASDAETKPWAHVKPPLPAETGRFRQPTDVTWDPAGDIFISDGYINSRVAKLNKDGDWIKSWGEPGNGEGQFSTAAQHRRRRQRHTLCRRPQQPPHPGVRQRRQIPAHHPHRHSADRGRAAGDRQQAQSDQLPADRRHQTPGAPWALCITPPPNQVLYVSDAFPGRIYKLTLDGKVLGMFGRSGKQLKEFGWVHAIACPNENTLYVAEILNWRVQKLILHPDQAHATNA